MTIMLVKYAYLAVHENVLLVEKCCLAETKSSLMMCWLQGCDFSLVLGISKMDPSRTYFSHMNDGCAHYKICMSALN